MPLILWISCCENTARVVVVIYKGYPIILQDRNCKSLPLSKRKVAVLSSEVIAN